MWVRCSRRKIPKSLWRVSGDSHQLPQHLRTGPLRSCLDFHRELQSALWNSDCWLRSDWIDRLSGISDLWCENHLPFRIPPLLSSTCRFHLPLPHLYLSANPPAPSLSHLNLLVLVGNRAEVTWLSLLVWPFSYFFPQHIFPHSYCVQINMFSAAEKALRNLLGSPISRLKKLRSYPAMCSFSIIFSLL